MNLNPAEYRISKTLAFPVFLLCFMASYIDTLAWMIPAWFSPRGFYSHSPLLMILVAHLLWREKNTLLAIPATTSGLPLSGLFLCSLLWLLAWAANLVTVQIFATYLVLLFGTCTIFGKYSYRVILPILFLVIFALPIWRPIQFILQDIATYAVQVALNIIGIAVFVEENFITIPTGIFEIEGGCSGVGFILVSLSLTCYLALLDRLQLVQLTKLLLISGVIALFANWVRILLIVLVGYYGGMDQPLVRDHVGFGWLVYSVIFFPYLFLATKFSRKGKEPAPAIKQIPTGMGLVTFFSMLVLSFAIPSAHIILERIANDRAPGYYEPPEVAGLFERQPDTPDWSPSFPSADYTSLASYTDQKMETLNVFVANYSNQKQGAEVVHIANRLYEKNHKLRDRSTLDTGVAKPSVVTELLLESADGVSKGIWYWYEVGDTAIATELEAKIAQVKQKLSGRGDAAIVVIFAECADHDCDRSRQNFLGIVKHL